MRAQPTATHEIADDATEADRSQAARLLRAIAADPLSVGELVLAALVEHRQAAYAAGLEAASDDAHASGYAEGVHAGRAETLTIIETMLEPGADPVAIAESLTRAQA